MSTSTLLQLPRPLGSGLELRWARPEDVESIAAFNAEIHSGETASASQAAIWTRDLLGGRHYSVRPNDCTIVVDTSVVDNGRPKLVSTLVLLSQVWSYEGIEFGVGQPELVGTHPDYRRRGLVRVQMETVHALSESRGELVQAITGIPWYYRQFGYEMTVSLEGSRHLMWARPENRTLRPAGEYQMRRAVTSDIPLLQELYRRGTAHSALRWVRSDAAWRFILNEQSPGSIRYSSYRIVERPDGTLLGYFAVVRSQDGSMGVSEAAAAAGTSWRELSLAIADALRVESELLGETGGRRSESLRFRLGEEHPVYRALGRQLEGQDGLYAFYVRVPDVMAFVRAITPVLEERLAQSVMAGHTGELKLNFHTRAIKLRLEGGRLCAVEPYLPEDFFDSDAFLPDLTFYHLLFGHRTLEELRFVRKDCWGRHAEAYVLTDCLFPKRLTLLYEFT